MLRAWRRGKFLLPDSAGTRDFAVVAVAHIECRKYFRNHLIGNAALAQCVRELDSAFASAVIRDIAFGKAPIREPVIGFEFVQHHSECFAIRTCIRQLVRELIAAVLAPRQQA